MEKEKLNSIEFRYGGTDTKVKFYFKDSKDLENQLMEFNKKSIKFANHIVEIKDRLKKVNDK